MNLVKGSLTFAETGEELVLVGGSKLGPITVAYETYGQLNEKADNAILILHALSGDAHVAGKYKESDKKPGWWDLMVGPGKPFDTKKYFLVCSNVLGGCSGSTGPSSIDPRTGKPYGMNFPIITIKDMVNAQHVLMKHLGISQWLSLAGGSMGGMQVLQWAQSYPEAMRSAIAIATTARLSPQAIAFNEVGRQAIIGDPDWNKGAYYDKKKKPDKGLSIARMLGHITYLSDQSMHQKFGRHLQDAEKYRYEFLTEFQVESYLHYQGAQFTQRFDANTYIYLTKAIDYFNLADGFPTLKTALSMVKCKLLVISFTSDWLFPTYQAKEIVSALRANDLDVSFCEIESNYGHDAFLLPNETHQKMIKGFLANI